MLRFFIIAGILTVGASSVGYVRAGDDINGPKQSIADCALNLTQAKVVPSILKKFAHAGESLDNAELRLVTQWFLFHNGNQILNRSYFRLWRRWANGARDRETLDEIEAHENILQDIKRAALTDDTSILWRLNIQKNSRLISIESLYKKNKKPLISIEKFARDLMQISPEQRLRYLEKIKWTMPSLAFDELLVILVSFKGAAQQYAAFEILREKTFMSIESLEIENYFSLLKKLDDSVVRTMFADLVVTEQDFQRIVHTIPENEEILQQFIQNRIFRPGYIVPNAENAFEVKEAQIIQFTRPESD